MSMKYFVILFFLTLSVTSEAKTKSFYAEYYLIPSLRNMKCEEINISGKKSRGLYHDNLDYSASPRGGIGININTWSGDIDFILINFKNERLDNFAFYIGKKHCSFFHEYDSNGVLQFIEVFQDTNQISTIHFVHINNLIYEYEVNKKGVRTKLGLTIQGKDKYEYYEEGKLKLVYHLSTDQEYVFKVSTKTNKVEHDIFSILELIKIYNIVDGKLFTDCGIEQRKYENKDFIDNKIMTMSNLIKWTRDYYPY